MGILTVSETNMCIFRIRYSFSFLGTQYSNPYIVLHAWCTVFGTVRNTVLYYYFVVCLFLQYCMSWCTVLGTLHSIIISLNVCFCSTA